MTRDRAVVRYSILTILALGACSSKDSSTAPQAASVAGVWKGPFLTDFGATRYLHLNLTQGTDSVSGTCGFGDASDTIYYACNAGGTFVNPNVTLTLTASGSAPLGLQGALSNSTTIAGTLCCEAGLTNAAVTLTKQ